MLFCNTEKTIMGFITLLISISPSHLFCQPVRLNTFWIIRFPGYPNRPRRIIETVL